MTTANANSIPLTNPSLKDSGIDLDQKGLRIRKRNPTPEAMP
ncbi:MAG: hypothetical protein N3G78_06975 [Desulfobacterota bacterium]|nr:hypothetical protein [Thermodesulfobacteriota bacterium]